jgi:hypothetical protein
MPIDIFPEIDVPVMAVVWTFNGMPAQDVQNRILTLHERQLASEVDDIERIEATSYYGVGVEKIFLHQGADVTSAIFDQADQRMQSIVGVIRRTKLIARNVGLQGEPLTHRADQAGFADACLTREQNDLALPVLRPLPNGQATVRAPARGRPKG